MDLLDRGAAVAVSDRIFCNNIYSPIAIRAAAFFAELGLLHTRNTTERRRMNETIELRARPLDISMVGSDRMLFAWDFRVL